MREEAPVLVIDEHRQIGGIGIGGPRKNHAGSLFRRKTRGT
jgi:hypothetical protein